MPTPPTVHSASETLTAPGFYMQDFQEQSVILFQEVVMLKEANMIPAIAGVTLTRAEELATERSSILAADEVRYKHVVRLNLDQKAYEKHNRRAEIVAAMFLKRKLYALGLHRRTAVVCEVAVEPRGTGRQHTAHSELRPLRKSSSKRQASTGLPPTKRRLPARSK